MNKIDWSIYTPFQQKVYKALLKVPKGKVVTYKQLAVMIGKPHAARAVGNAMATNMHAPMIPCHRVIRSDKGLGGYSAPGGIKKKIALLRQEGYLV